MFRITLVFLSVALADQAVGNHQSSEKRESGRQSKQRKTNEWQLRQDALPDTLLVGQRTNEVMKRTDCWWCWYCFFFKQQQRRVGLEFLVLPRSLEKGHLCLQTSLLSSSLFLSFFSLFAVNVWQREQSLSLSPPPRYPRRGGARIENLLRRHVSAMVVCVSMSMHVFICLPFPSLFLTFFHRKGHLHRRLHRLCSVLWYSPIGSVCLLLLLLLSLPVQSMTATIVRQRLSESGRVWFCCCWHNKE